MENNELVEKKIFVEPGYAYLSYEEALLCAVLGSGVAVTLFDKEKKIGGMNYFIKTESNLDKENTPHYSRPAILGLLKLFTDAGSNITDLEAHIFGGAENPTAKGFVGKLAYENISRAIEILKEKNIHIDGKDTGGKRGRKIVFNTKTGETYVAKVEKIREDDWYPSINSSKKRG